MFSVPIELIRKPTRHWKYAVLTGFQGDEEGNLGHVGGEFIKLKNREETELEFSPNIVDILTLKDFNQKEILNSYDEQSSKLALIPMLNVNKM